MTQALLPGLVAPEEPDEALGPDVVGDAAFSPDGNYRWWLTRYWPGGSCPPWVFCGLNPSRAGATRNDPTATRMMRRARAAGASGLVIVNLFAWVDPYRRGIRLAPDPVGELADDYLRIIPDMGEPLICGWGDMGGFNARDCAVLKLFREFRRELWAFPRTKAGRPGHPLYLSYSVHPERWTPGGDYE